MLTVGSIQAGSEEQRHPRPRPFCSSTSAPTATSRRTAMLDAIRRIVTAECAASGSPREPEFELFDRFPLTDNDDAVTDRVAEAFTAFFGDRVHHAAAVASEDFSDIPNALGVPYTYWGIGGIDPRHYRRGRGGAGSPRTSRSTTPRFSPRSSNPPSTPARRPWSSPRWPGCEKGRAVTALADPGTVLVCGEHFDDGSEGCSAPFSRPGQTRIELPPA